MTHRKLVRMQKENFTQQRLDGRLVRGLLMHSQTTDSFFFTSRVTRMQGQHFRPAIQTNAATVQTNHSQVDILHCTGNVHLWTDVNQSICISSKSHANFFFLRICREIRTRSKRHVGGRRSQHYVLHRCKPSVFNA